MALALKRHYNIKLNGLKRREDSFVNPFTGRGTRKDRNTATTFQSNLLLTARGNLNLYNGSGVGKRAIDRWANDSTREWILVNNDPESDITTTMDLLDTQSAFNVAMKWALGTGNGVIFMGIDDGAENSIEPLNENNIQRIHFLKVYDKDQIIKNDIHINNDAMSPNFGKQEFYEIHSNGGINSGQFTVHHSRILEFNGITTDDLTFNNNGNSHLSMFQTMFARLDGLDSAYIAAQEAMENFYIDVLHMAGLFQHFQSGQQGQITARLEILDLSKASRNMFALDPAADEKLERLGVNISGLHELITKLEHGISSVTGVPSVILFGQSSKSGLNSNSDNEIRMYYDEVHSLQKEKILKPLIRLCTLIQLSKDGPTGGVVDPSKTIKFKGLWQLTEKEKADNYKTIAEADAVYIDRGVLDQIEVTKGRFNDDPNITLESGHLNGRMSGHDEEEDDNTSHNSGHKKEKKD